MQVGVGFASAVGGLIALLLCLLPLGKKCGTSKFAKDLRKARTELGLTLFL